MITIRNRGKEKIILYMEKKNHKTGAVTVNQQLLSKELSEHREGGVPPTPVCACNPRQEGLSQSSRGPSILSLQGTQTDEGPALQKQTLVLCHHIIYC